MLTKTMTYKDFNGNDVTETFMFNLTTAEIAELELTASGAEGIGAFIDAILKSKSYDELITFFKRIILKSFGMKSEDGKRFVKSEALSKEFSETNAFSDLFMELISGADAATAFINGIASNALGNQHLSAVNAMPGAVG